MLLPGGLELLVDEVGLDRGLWVQVGRLQPVLVAVPHQRIHIEVEDAHEKAEWAPLEAGASFGDVARAARWGRLVGTRLGVAPPRAGLAFAMLLPRARGPSA